ncbi:uncharacterized protein N7479_002703 [Penicillium vulpinum]|uniref:60S ribosomal subunit assembly/export protein LOC1 n=1 Tax=Penicillium vulpinum TaxID=29845 RepID=A0A1V6RTL9_9EURO|nr:uncharacterized protein N7479_002703 [Penicillium vulpinum]KAJ5972785.1 hypothetical protein N7479_002703 [Penicillium vulpinum]OQE05117.1 hypothetical protein PENVUL_c027G05174 [Penicillium vulpinum]
MAPSKGPNVGGAKGLAKGGAKGGKSSLSSASRVSKSKDAPKRPPAKEQKTKPRTVQENLKKKKKRVYTEKELDLPELNQITPVGVIKPKGKKKGKTFVDDAEGMMTILAMVNAEKEGQIESKMMKARQLEEIREAKRAEAEARMKERKNKFDDVKDSIRQKKKGKGDKAAEATSIKDSISKPGRSKKKTVAFA